MILESGRLIAGGALRGPRLFCCLHCHQEVGSWSDVDSPVSAQMRWVNVVTTS